MEQELQIAVKIIKMFEGCNLVAYPDPASDFYKALSANNLLRKWLKGEVGLSDIPKDLQKLSGAPWTIGWGETRGVKCGDVWTQEEADKRLEARVAEFLTSTIKTCTKLNGEPPERAAACTSLAYNIGKDAFAKSTVARKINEGSWHCAADAFLMWTKAGGVEMEGLVKRRNIEREIFMSRSM